MRGATTQRRDRQTPFLHVEPLTVSFFGKHRLPRHFILLNGIGN
jgi:hypothetical protein